MNISRQDLRSWSLGVFLMVVGFIVSPAALALPTSVKGVKVYDTKQFREAGWKIPQPPYPYAAMKAHEQGTVYVQLTTDSSGRIVTATAKKTAHPHLDESLAEWAKANGHGPPNMTVITSFTFRIG